MKLTNKQIEVLSKAYNENVSLSIIEHTLMILEKLEDSESYIISFKVEDKERITLLERYEELNKKGLQTYIKISECDVWLSMFDVSDRFGKSFMYDGNIKSFIEGVNLQINLGRIFLS